MEALIHNFGEDKPPYKIFKELFSREQSPSEPTDVFISHARALLAKLPPTPQLNDIHKVDMVYGLLNKNIRKGVPRDSATSFEQLITKARAVEEKLETHEDTRRDVED